MGLIENFISVLKNFRNFSGRARRREFWLFYLCFAIINVVFQVLGAIPGIGSIFGIIGGLVSLVLLLPSIAVAIRRLHDIGRKGIFLLFFLVPLVGQILLIIWWVKEGDSGPNSFGPDPKAA